PETTWYWPGIEHVDPAKEASAEDVRLANHTTTLAAAYARQGKDWERELRQRARERKLAKKLGLTDTEARPSDASVAELDAPAEPAATKEKTGAAA
ncbi:MAG TPA: phage portal protein, partial [Phycisphaerae bacterium]|nr:phage portal protein [Phycisphaerae bacterium]